MAIKIIAIIRIIYKIAIIFICTPLHIKIKMVYGYRYITARMHSYTFEADISAKILRNSGGRCISILAGNPNKQEFSSVFDPPQLHERDATEAHIWPNVYLAEAKPREPIRIVRVQPEQTRADGSMAKTWRCVEFTWNLSLCSFARCNPVRFITCYGTIPMPTS
jgi:hypothetical protein